MRHVPARIEALHRYWRSLADGKPPQRRQIDPAEIHTLLPFMLIVEFEDDPFRVRFRLTGTQVDEISHQNLTGHYLDEFAVGIGVEPVGELQCRYATCRATGQPYIGTYRWPAEGGFLVEVWFGLFPLMLGDEIRQCLSIEDYGELTPSTVPVDWVSPKSEE